MLKGLDQQSLMSAFGQPPRDVVRTGGVPVPLRIALYLLIPHVWVGVWMIGMILLDPAMALFGSDAKVTIVSRELLHSKGSRCRIVYRYDDGADRETGTATFRAEDYAGYAPGNELTARFVRVGPFHVSRLPEDRSNLNGCCMFPFALIWNGMMIAMFYQWCLSPLVAKRLIAGGQPAIARITAKDERTGWGRRGVDRIISYVYKPADGPERVGTMNLSTWDFEPAQIGQAIVIFYDAVSGKSVIYRYSKYAVKDIRGYAITE